MTGVQTCALPISIAAMDFFTVPTLTFGVLYCFFIIGHDRRRILHFNVTRDPTSPWIVQQLREAFPYDSAPRFLLLDHDAKYGLEVPASIRSLKMTPVRTSIQSPWQVLPEGWYLTASSIPAKITQLQDGRIRLDFWNGRPDEVDVLIKAKRRER